MRAFKRDLKEPFCSRREKIELQHFIFFPLRRDDHAILILQKKNNIPSACVYLWGPRGWQSSFSREEGCRKLQERERLLEHQIRDRIRSSGAIPCPGAVVLVFTVSAGLIVSACSLLCPPKPPRLREISESKGRTEVGQEMNAGGAAEWKEKVQERL